jgi:hypothetical protein
MECNRAEKGDAERLGLTELNSGASHKEGIRE